MTRRCEFCLTGAGGYTCPRCNKDYCGLKCYQSSSHSRCSEHFYKECVQAELVGDNLSEESRQKMQQILARMSREQEESDSEVDSDDDEDEEDLAVRLQGVDLDDAHSVWEKLSKSERREFTEFVEKGDVTSLLPEFTPWWSQNIQVPKIQEVDAPEDTSYMRQCPAVWEDIPDFGAIFPRGAPSDKIKYGVMNLVYGYAYAVRFFHGDYKKECMEFVDTVERLVGKEGSLGGREFDLADTAVETAASRVNLNPDIAVSLEFSRQVKKDVYKIIKGPTEKHKSFYLLAALSDLRVQYLKCIQQLKSNKKSTKTIENKSTNSDDNKDTKVAMFSNKTPDLDMKVLKVHIKKIEFYLSWTSKYHDQQFQLL